MCYYAAFHGKILYLTDKHSVLYHSTDIASLEKRKTVNTLNSVWGGEQGNIYHGDPKVHWNVVPKVHAKF